MSNIINYMDYLNERNANRALDGIVFAKQTDGEATGDSTRDGKGTSTMVPKSLFTETRISQSRYSLFSCHDRSLQSMAEVGQNLPRESREAIKLQLKALSEEERELLYDLLKILDMKMDEFLPILQRMQQTLGYFLRELNFSMKAFRIPSLKQESHLNAIIENNILDKEFIKAREAKAAQKQRFYPTPLPTTLRPRRGHDKE